MPTPVRLRGGSVLRGTTSPFGLLVSSLGAAAAFLLVRPLFGAGPYYGPRTASTGYAYNWLVLALFVPYALALTAYKRGNRPSLRAVIVAAACVWGVLVFAPLSQSQDVYQYLFYGKMQLVHGANPYVVPPVRFTADPWLAYVGWPTHVSVYGPLWTLSTAALVALAGFNLTAGLILAKAFAVALGGLTVWGLIRIARRPATGLVSDPAFAVLAFALNPLVVWSLAMSGHADAAVAAAFVWAMVADRRGRPLLASLLLAAAALVKAYAGALMVVFVWARLRRGGWRAGLASAASAVALAVAAWGPYWAGAATFRGLLETAAQTSSSLAGTTQLIVERILRAAGVTHPDGPAAVLVRSLALATMATTCLVLSRAAKTAREPWRAGALLMGAYLLVTPWFLPWHAVGLIALACAVADAGLAATVLTFSGTCLVTIPGTTLLGSLARSFVRYGGPGAVYAVHARRSPPRSDP